MRTLITWRWIPVLPAAVVLVVGELLGLGHNLALLILTAPLVLLLFCIAVSLGLVILLLPRDQRTRSAVIALASVIVALVSIPAAMTYGGPLRDPLAFLLWWQTNPGPMTAWAGKDGVVRHWDGWGFAGLENDSYLVSDAGDSIADLAAANRWAQNRNLDCEIVATQRMWRGFYILTTANCAFQTPDVSPLPSAPPAHPPPGRSVPE